RAIASVRLRGRIRVRSRCGSSSSRMPAITAPRTMKGTASQKMLWKILKNSWTLSRLMVSTAPARLEVERSRSPAVPVAHGGGARQTYLSDTLGTPARVHALRRRRAGDFYCRPGGATLQGHRAVPDDPRALTGLVLRPGPLYDERQNAGHGI